MGAKKSQRKAAFVVFGIIATGYLVNLFIFNLPEESQYTVGGLALIASGAACLYFTGAPETLSCDRSLNTCRLTRPRFLLTPKSVEIFPLDRVRDACVIETQVSSHDGPPRKAYEVRLEIGDGRAHVSSTEDSKRRADALARRIKSFLKDDGHGRLKLRRFPWVVDAVGVALMIFGALLVLNSATGWPDALRG